MAQIVIYSFLSPDGYAYDVTFDDVTETLTVNTGGDPTLEIDLVEPYPYAPAEVLYSYCKNTTLISVRFQPYYPFADIIHTADSPECGFAPPPCSITIDSVTMLQESFEGYHDGQATINISSSNATGILFSLDNIHFQADNHFTGLYPGNYTAYVKSAEGCNVTKNFSILSGAILPGSVQGDIEFPWYDRVCKWFRLIRDGITYPISEPIKFDNVNVVGKRDKDWHGFNYMFSDGIIELEFDCEAGMEVIEAEYNSKGSDGVVLFQHGYTYQGEDHILFPGKIDLNTRKKYPGKVTASVEKEDFNAVFISRFETKVSLTDTKTKDGLDILPPAPVEFILHPKEIIRKYKINSSAPQTVGNESIRFSRFQYVHPDTSSPELSEIETGYGYPLNISAQEPGANDLYNWVAKFAGVYDFDIQYTVELTMTAAFQNNSYRITNIFRVNDIEIQVGSILTGGLFTPSVAFPNQTVSRTVLYHAQLPYDIQFGDRIFFYTKVEFLNSGGTSSAAVVMYASQGAVQMNVSALERSTPTPAKGWMIFDTINHVTQAVTNKAAKLKSSFFSLKNSFQAIDGQGSLFITTNGKQIRRFEIEKFPLNINLKDLLNSVKAIFCVGYGFEKKGNQEYVVVERADYFYKRKEILTVDECSSYREETAKDILYNEYDFGYDKYLEEGYNTLDEFNTRHEYLTAIKTNKLKLTQRSTLIGSGYAIEDVRRKQFAETATNSVAHDDDGFIIAMRRQDAGFVPEKNEAFQTVENVISPNTAYNLRISPRRMVVNWGVLLSSPHNYKQPTDNITNTYVAQNGELITQFKDDEPNPVGDVNRRQWKENELYPLSRQFEDAPRLFSPEWIYFKTRLTPDKANLINESLAGKRTDDTNYGYIKVKDENDEYQAGYPFETEYNYSTEMFTCKMLKKFGGPEEDCCDYLVVNGCYLKVNGHKIIV